MSTIRCILPVIALLLLSTTAFTEEDRILARVNSDIITLSDLEERMRPIIAKYETSYSGEELLQKLAEAEKYWLDQLIENKLILQEADRKQITATQEEIDDRYRQIKQDFDSELQFNIFLESQGMNIDQLKKSIAENIKISKATMHIREKARQEISPTDVSLYYKEHIDQFTEDPRVRAFHILIRTSDNDGEALQKAQSILKRIKAGEDFSVLAREFSEDPHAQEGGDMGFITRGQHMPEIDKAVFSMKVGQVSDIIKSNIGYHIIMVKQIKKARTKPFVEVQEEIENNILREKARELWDSWINGLKKKSFIEIYHNKS